jgi:hypothetical protein
MKNLIGARLLNQTKEYGLPENHMPYTYRTVCDIELTVRLCSKYNHMDGINLTGGIVITVKDKREYNHTCKKIIFSKRLPRNYSKTRFNNAVYTCVKNIIEFRYLAKYRELTYLANESVNIPDDDVDKFEAKGNNIIFEDMSIKESENALIFINQYKKII